MINQQTNHSDISAVFNQNITNQNTAAGNRNISNVLSQIQDDGPAYSNPHTDSHAHLSATSQRQDNLINLRSEKSDNISGGQASESLHSEKKQPDLSAVLKKGRGKPVAAMAINKKNSAWVQPSLISFAAVIIVFFLFRIDARTNQLEVSLNSLDEEVLDTVDYYSSELTPKFRSIKNTLKEVRKDLEIIKASTESELKPGDLTVDNLATNETLQPVVNDNAGIMNDEILALKNELKIAKDKLKTLSENKGVYKSPDINGQITAAEKISTTGWVANLASFTDKNQADKALEPLYEAGLSPLVQQVNVNGKRIYRLIVDGFVSIADAKLFIRRAGHEFGLPGGWIIKS